MRALVPDEHTEQKALFQWVTLSLGKYPQLLNMAAVPNGGLRNKVVAGKLRAEGVKKGYPDILLDWPSGEYHGLRIEMKRTKGSQTSKDQHDWIERLNNAGYLAVVCHGWVHAKQVIEMYLRGEL